MSSAGRLALGPADLADGRLGRLHRAHRRPVRERTGSAAWVSAALFAGVVGSVIGAPAAGYLGDRFDRQRVMIATDLASAAVASTMASVIDEPTALVELFGLLAFVTSPFAPASAAAMPNLVGEEAVARANALVATTTSAGYLLGPLAGGLLLGVGVSAPALFAVDAATFVVSAVLIASIRRPFGSGRGTESHPGVLAGVRLIRREAVLRILIAASMVSLLGMGIVNVAAYPLSLRLDGGTEGNGAMEALLGGGGLLGAALAGRLLTTARAPTIVATSFAVSGLGLALSGMAPVLLVALAERGDAGERRARRARWCALPVEASAVCALLAALIASRLRGRDAHQMT